ncbi:hypothetical protein TNIN_397881 [Trichonephila inaurata madagascariensis]|uniref:Uncharacterized protein n=1 Tax=Trichonephila inaurata madagascariensis TaxID=2747483 RepID=A0A8X7CCR4_9ARAC|nr:hypothetical protein TNIN_397881 [Trichonephila inaurata madagascariensis]
MTVSDSVTIDGACLTDKPPLRRTVEELLQRKNGDAVDGVELLQRKNGDSVVSVQISRQVVFRLFIREGPERLINRSISLGT